MQFLDRLDCNVEDIGGVENRLFSKLNISAFNFPFLTSWSKFDTMFYVMFAMVEESTWTVILHLTASLVLLLIEPFFY